MKVYLVTEGCYSDYHIEAAFSTKEKAEELVEAMGRHSSAGIEEFELDQQFDQYMCIEIQVQIKSGSPVIKSKTIRITNFLTDYIRNATYFSNYLGYELQLKRFVPIENCDEIAHLLKYEKAAYDFMNIALQKIHEGFSVRDVNQMFNSEEVDVNV